MYIGSLIENYDEYKYACEALNQYIYNGDMTLLEAYSEGIIIPLDESKRREEKRELKRLRKRELIPQEVLRRMKKNDDINLNPFFYRDDREGKYDDDKSQKNINLVTGVTLNRIMTGSNIRNIDNFYDLNKINDFIERRNKYEEGSKKDHFHLKLLLNLKKQK